jgi:hypothetical protein
MLNRRQNVKKCYVCMKEILKDESSVYLTGGFYRHFDCYIGSANWSKYKKEGKYNILFETKGEDNGIQ